MNADRWVKSAQLRTSSSALEDGTNRSPRPGQLCMQNHLRQASSHPNMDQHFLILSLPALCSMSTDFREGTRASGYYRAQTRDMIHRVGLLVFPGIHCVTTGCRNWKVNGSISGCLFCRANPVGSEENVTNDNEDGRQPEALTLRIVVGNIRR